MLDGNESFPTGIEAQNAFASKGCGPSEVLEVVV